MSFVFEILNVNYFRQICLLGSILNHKVTCTHWISDNNDVEVYIGFLFLMSLELDYISEMRQKRPYFSLHIWSMSMGIGLNKTNREK
jgi:hypothetical protein